MLPAASVALRASSRGVQAARLRDGLGANRQRIVELSSRRPDNALRRSWRRRSLLAMPWHSFAGVPPLAMCASPCPEPREKPHRLQGNARCTADLWPPVALIPPLLPMSRATWNRNTLAWKLSAPADILRVHAVADERPFRRCRFARSLVSPLRPTLAVRRQTAAFMRGQPGSSPRPDTAQAGCRRQPAADWE
jgi:hypothetical protein